MDFLPQQNRRVSGEPLGNVEPILAGGKHVVVIGGGDTGSDCIGTSFRQGALSVTQLEIMPRRPSRRTRPDLAELAAEDAHLLEPGRRRQARLRGADAEVFRRKRQGEKLHCVQVDDKFKPIPGTEFELEADLVLLAMGFVHPVHEGMIKTLGVDLDQRGNVRANTADYQTSRAEGVFRRRHAPRPIAGRVGDPRGERRTSRAD
jgi:glutamate synthase (NADPH/NADH) small chain